MKFRSLYAVIYVTAIGIILSFALSWGEKKELHYYDFAEVVTYNIDRDNRSDDGRYAGIGLDVKKRDEIQNIFSNFESSDFFDNSFDLDSWNGQVMIYYHLIIIIKNKSYILTILDCKDIEDNYFWLDKIDKFDSKFCYTEENPILFKFKNRKLSEKLDGFIRKNRDIIDKKMSKIEQNQPKYSSPIIQWFHKHYSEAAVWAENRYYDFIDP